MVQILQLDINIHADDNFNGSHKCMIKLWIGSRYICILPVELRTGFICKWNFLHWMFFFFFFASEKQDIFLCFLWPGLFCYPCVKVKFPHKSWQVWNYVRKCFIPCHLPSLITTPYTHPHTCTPTHPNRPQLTGWSGSHFFKQLSKGEKKKTCKLFMKVLLSTTLKLYAESWKAFQCFVKGIQFGSLF